MLLNIPKDDLVTIVKDSKTPILISGVAAALLKDMGKGRTLGLQWITERDYGKAKETINVLKTDLTQLSREERTKRIDELEKKRNSNNDI